MLDESELREVDRTLLSLRILWAAFLVALLVYIVVANVADIHLESGDDPDVESAFDVVRYVLYGMSVALLTGAWTVHRHILNADSRISRIVGAFSPFLSAADTGSEGVRSAAAKYYITAVIAFSLCESVGIFGLVLCFIDSDFFSLYLLVSVAAVSLFMVRPRKEELIELATRTKSGRP